MAKRKQSAYQKAIKAQRKAAQKQWKNAPSAVPHSQAKKISSPETHKSIGTVRSVNDKGYRWKDRKRDELGRFI